MGKSSLNKPQHKEVAKRLNFFVFTMVDDISDDPKVTSFLFNYIACENAVKQIAVLFGYESSAFKMDLKSVTSVLRKYGVSLNPDLMSRVFSATIKRNQKSCKKLRDGIVHSLNKRDLIEIRNRYTYLMDDMQQVQTALINRR